MFFQLALILITSWVFNYFSDLTNASKFGVKHINQTESEGVYMVLRAIISTKTINKGLILKGKIRQNFNPFKYTKPIIMHISHTRNDFLILGE